MTHVDYRLWLIVGVPLVLVFVAGLAAGLIAVFLVCNLPLMKRTWDHGRTISFTLSAALSLSGLVLLGSILSALILRSGYLGQDVYVPENFPLFLLRPAVEFFVVLLAALGAALLTFGALRYGSELVQRIVVPGVFIAVFILALSLTKTWSSYWILAESFDADLFAGTLYQIVSAELGDIAATFSHVGRLISSPGSGLFSQVFADLGADIRSIWQNVRSAGGNQFVLAETFPEIFAVSAMLALLYMVLRWPFTAFTEPDES